MVKKIKNTVSISLVIILLLPITVQLFDQLFHHHDHFVCTVKNEKHLHKHHEKCLISNFVLSSFVAKKQTQQLEKPLLFDNTIDNYSFLICHNTSKYSFLLRGPPNFTI